MSFALELTVERTDEIANFENKLRDLFGKSKSPFYNDENVGNRIYDDISIKENSEAALDFLPFPPGDRYFYTEANSEVIDAYNNLCRMEKSVVDNDLSLKGVYLLLSSSSGSGSFIAINSKNIKISQYTSNYNPVIELPDDDHDE